MRLTREVADARPVATRNRCEGDHTLSARVAGEPLGETIERIPARVRSRNGIRWEFQNHAQRVHNASPIHVFQGVKRANRFCL